MYYIEEWCIALQRSSKTQLPNRKEGLRVRQLLRQVCRLLAHSARILTRAVELSDSVKPFSTALMCQRAMARVEYLFSNLTSCFKVCSVMAKRLEFITKDLNALQEEWCHAALLAHFITSRPSEPQLQPALEPQISSEALSLEDNELPVAPHVRKNAISDFQLFPCGQNFITVDSDEQPGRGLDILRHRLKFSQRLCTLLSWKPSYSPDLP